MSDTSCGHLDKIADAKDNYNIVLAYYVTCIAEDAAEKKATDAFCRLCKKSNRRLHACLECAFFGCFDQENGKESHMKFHYLQKTHCIAININHGCLFCFKCNDYIYNKTFEDIYNEHQLEARKIDGNRFYRPWKPNAEERALLQNKIKKISDDSNIGVRGIVNIGNSCYANVIIQAFVHNPIMRDYFLSDQHRCFLEENCLTCEMFILFQEFYSGISVSFNPSKRFFAVLQNYCGAMLGYDQQDTSELLLEMLTGLHCSFEKTHQTDNCTCTIHKIFYGSNQNYKKCSHCTAVSYVPLDHFIDIVLDLDRQDDSLVEILNRKYLEPQLLSDYKCSTCKQINTTYLYEAIKKLPTVICFRMNCFRIHKKPNRKQRIDKKSTAFAFQEWIEMSPYLNSKGDTKLLKENRYQLFAVIFHKSFRGDISGGHYSIYVRQRRNKWYECDDHRVYKRSFQEVLACEPHLLFYYKEL